MRCIGALRIRPDPFVLSLVGVVLAATLFPCRGALATAVHAAGVLAISSLFFLQGARLSRDAIISGITHWRLHATIGMTTFILFPLIAVCLAAFFHHLLPQPLWVGVMFACALPSTVQSSIALTSIARGNVAGAICAATASNLAGMVLTPVILTALSQLHGDGASLQNVGAVLAELLVPFIIGHLMRPRIGRWTERNGRTLSFADRGSILLVVYSAFSTAVINGVWRDLPPATLLMLGIIMGVILLVALAAIVAASRVQQFGKPDEVAAVFCGSQKSLVSGVPIANALFSGAAIGPSLMPIMIYYLMQLVVCAWMARHYADRPAVVPNLSIRAQEEAIIPLPDHV